jgi:hypothetical protein
MSFLVLQAYVKLISFESCLRRNDFTTLYNMVRDCPVSARVSPPGDVERICSGVNTACIWYWKEVLCLQRSAAAACLLKTYGVSAQMVIGAKLWPFAAHAWVEVDGRVVNDKPYMPELYTLLLDRC